MEQCPNCGVAQEGKGASCPACGQAYAASTPTSAPPISGAPTSGPPDATDRGSAGETLGTILGGRYRLEALLGRGAMGEVYRAEDLKLGQVVALKFLPAAIANSESARQRFISEVKLG